MAKDKKKVKAPNPDKGAHKRARTSANKLKRVAKDVKHKEQKATTPPLKGVARAKNVG